MKKLLIVTANYYPDISKKLKNRAIKTIEKFKMIDSYKEITTPGVFEIPVTIARNIESYDGVVALGCIIKGKTPHFELIAKSVIEAILNLSIAYKKPIGNGILTCLNKKQAIERIHKAEEASIAVKKLLLSEVS